MTAFFAAVVLFEWERKSYLFGSYNLWKKCYV